MNRGAWGEKTAAAYLENKGYIVLARNYRTRWGEIDLIVADTHFIAFVEVKTRRTNRFSQACEAVTPAKQRKLIQTALCWLSEHPAEKRQPRFDVVEVYDLPGYPRIHHMKNAFDAFDS